MARPGGRPGHEGHDSKGTTLALWDQGVTTGMRGLAARLGLRYCGNTGDRGYRDDIGEFTRLGPLLDIDPGKQVTDLIYGRYHDRNIEVFNAHLGSYVDDPRSPIRSCTVVTFTASFPVITIEPHTRMTKLRLGANRTWLDFAPEDFRQRFHIDAPDNEVARSVLSDELIAWLMAGRDDVRLVIDGSALLGHVGQIPEDDERWQELIDYVVGFHGAIPAQAWVDYSVFGTLG
jgi:hypothetical protein